MRRTAVKTGRRARARTRPATGRTAMVLVAAIALSQPLRAQAQATGADVQNVSISVPGGAALAGRYRDAGPGAPGVLLFPMCGPRGVDGWSPVAERLRSAGVSSLMVQEPGYGPNGAREARADAAVAYLRSRVGESAPIALTGGSCGVSLALSTASRHPAPVRAVVVLSGPYGDELLDHVRKTPALAVFAGASEGEPPSPVWARALKTASTHPASRVEIWTPRSHGTEYFVVNPSFAGLVADWLAERLAARSVR